MLDPNKVGMEIRNLRESKGLTQEQLSGLATLDRVFKIAFALDIKPHELIQVIEEKVPFYFDE